MCPLCNSTQTQNWGSRAFHTIDEIAGISSKDIVGREFCLKKCSNCGLVFKFPFLSEEILGTFYTQSQASHWGVNPHKHFFEIEKLAAIYGSGQNVLDVGCSNGAMLSVWGKNWNKYGVEYSNAAAVVAEQKAIKIMGKAITELKNTKTYDVITMIDLIEHVPKPDEIINKALTLLRPGGVIIMFTGNCEHWCWKIEKGGYWYVSFPEHICFYSDSVFHFIQERYGLKIVFQNHGSHEDVFTYKTYMTQLFKNIAFYFVSKIMRMLRFRHNILNRGYPSFTLSKDHILVALQKPNEQPPGLG